MTRMGTTVFLIGSSVPQWFGKKLERQNGLINFCSHSQLVEDYNFRMRKLRLALAFILLILSLGLLAWGVWPAARERHILPISPSEMTLPTPASFDPGFMVSPVL